MNKQQPITIKVEVDNLGFIFSRPPDVHTPRLFYRAEHVRSAVGLHDLKQILHGQ